MKSAVNLLWLIIIFSFILTGCPPIENEDIYINKESDKNDPNKIDPDNNEPGDVDPNETEPGENEPGDTDPNETEPGENEPGGEDPNETEPGNTEPTEPEPTEPEPVEPEPTEPEPTEPEPTEPEPTEPEPTEPEPADEIIFIFNAEKITENINKQAGTKADPSVLNLSFEIGSMANSASNWKKLLNVIAAAGKYVSLDLSGCTLETHSYPYFFPDHDVPAGKDKIVNLILPDTATHITGRNSSDDFTFLHFLNLEYVSGANITFIGSWAFYNRGNLKEIDLPRVTEIDQGAFYDCVNLKKADFPLAVKVADNAFRNCSSLKSANIPNLGIITTHLFFECVSLTSASFPKATIIYQNAFENCINLTEADFPSAVTIGNEVFKNCIKLETVSMPKAEIIHSQSFFNCVSLENINFSSAMHIASYAFYNCTSLTEAVFNNVKIVEPMSFANCTSLERVKLLANPGPAKDANLLPVHPLYPWLSGIQGLPCVGESILIYNLAFDGCTSLKILDIRNAWNVYFAGNALVNIGTELTLYLFDDDGVIGIDGEIKDNYSGKSYGHPQLDVYLGANPSLQSIKIIAPNGTQIEKGLPGIAGYPGIASDIKSRYSGIEVIVERK